MIDFLESNICDVLPEVLAEDPHTQALGYAISQQLFKMEDYKNASEVLALIDEIPEAICDLLAVEWNTQYYDAENMTLAQKRNMVKNTLIWYMTAGTSSAVKDLLTKVFQSAELIELDDPYLFEIYVNSISSDVDISEFDVLLRNVKNVRSHLDRILLPLVSEGTLYGAVGKVYGAIITCPCGN